MPIINQKRNIKMKVSFKNSEGLDLAARLELPSDGKVKAYAIFAHCFTCSKNLTAVRNIARSLTSSGIGVLRFDFTGLGDSEGDFANTNFSTNVQDLYAASNFLKENYESPQLLIGHSLGGAAVLFAAVNIETVRAVVTIGAPFGPGHVSHLFKSSIEKIEEQGIANVNIGGRTFEVKKQFLNDIANADIKTILKNLNKALLILHSPQDLIVAIENASKIYVEAYHPKSFISLDGADHLLSGKEDSIYVGNVISTWVSRYLDIIPQEDSKSDHPIEEVPVSIVLNGDSYTTDVFTHDHHLIADEPSDLGGHNRGPNPFEYLLASLGSCTAITLRMYITRKKWDVTEIKINLDSKMEKDHYTIYRDLSFKGKIDDTQLKRLHEIANRCPVHKTFTERKIEITDKSSI